MASIDDITGHWTYRSFHNDPTPVGGNPDKALGLFFAEARFDLDVSATGALSGVIDWGSGGLDLSGTVEAGPNDLVSVAMTGEGRPGSQTEGWRYGYDGWLAHRWPEGIAQVPAIVGSVTRLKPHGGAPAGYVASFIAVRRS